MSCCASFRRIASSRGSGNASGVKSPDESIDGGRNMATETIDIAVVGGGMAGLNAAVAAAETGASTVLLDEQAAPLPGEHEHAGRVALRSRAAAAGVDLRYGSLVWGIFGGFRLAVLGPGAAAGTGATAVVLAPGSITVVEPSPGWTQPDIRLALMAESACGFAATLGGWVPGRARSLETSVPRLFVAGDGGGLCPEPDIASAEGRLAGLSAALSIGFGSAAGREEAAVELERAAPGRLTQIASLDAWYVQGSHDGIPPVASYSAEPPGSPASRTAPTETMICPCEGVHESVVLTAIAQGARSLNDVKRRTRAGMGICQGVQCGHPIRTMICAQTGIDPAQVPPMTSRPPVRLLRLADLAEMP